MCTLLQQIEQANYLIAKTETAFFTVYGVGGFPDTSAVALVRHNGIYTQWIATSLSSNKVKCLKNNAKAGLCMADETSNVTLMGNAVIHTDAETKQAMWQDWGSLYWSGPADPAYCLIAFQPLHFSILCEGVNTAFRFSLADITQPDSRCGLLCASCTFKEPYHCSGCIASGGKPFHGSCPIAECCQKKGYIHCGECGKMPCEALYAYSCLDEAHGDKPAGARLNMLRFWAGMPIQLQHLDQSPITLNS